MTAVGVRELAPRTAARARLRLVRLHLAGRRVTPALALLAGCGLLMWAAVHWHVTRGGARAQPLPLLLEAGCAAVVAVTTHSPFGEAERATGRWLPYLRLASAVGLTAASAGALAAGAAAAGGLDGGAPAVLRNVAGIAGVGLLTSVVAGGGLAWIGPMAYVVVAGYALLNTWTSPWIWPARPAHDHGAALCAALVFAAGVAAVTTRGARRDVL